MGFEVAVDDPADVRLADRVGGLHHVVDDTSDRERPLVGEHLVQVFALQILHHHVRDAGGQAVDVEDAHRVMALDRGCRAGFTRKTPSCVGRGQELGMHDLDRDGAIELDVCAPQHRAHAARAEEPVDPVFAAEHVAEREPTHERSSARHADARLVGDLRSRHRNGPAPSGLHDEHTAGIAAVEMLSKGGHPRVVELSGEVERDDLVGRARAARDGGHLYPSTADNDGMTRGFYQRRGKSIRK